MHSKVKTVECGNVFNFVSVAMKLTRGKLLKTNEWLGDNRWQAFEWKQLDQYDKQGMFGTPVHVDKKEAIFNLV